MSQAPFLLSLLRNLTNVAIYLEHGALSSLKFFKRSQFSLTTRWTRYRINLERIGVEMHFSASNCA